MSHRGIRFNFEVNIRNVVTGLICKSQRNLYSAVGLKVKRGFTLIELLVVIGIIALLVAMLMPALNKARDSAKQVQCAAQLKQLSMGLLNYANNNKGYFPTWSGWHTYGGKSPDNEGPDLAWSEVLEPYFTKPINQVFNCPA